MVLLLVSCSSKETPVEAEPTDFVETPTATEAPMAVRVNGEGVLMSDYEAELMRYQDAMNELGKEYDQTSASTEVLDELINQMLLAQSAQQAGYLPADGELQAKYNELASEIGSEDALRTWIFENHYDDESFRRTLLKEMAAIWMRNQIIASVPQTAPQVHARQILVNDENQAIAIERQLQIGTAFEDLARQYDPLTAGDLGWFPQGYLLQPDVENAAFSLNPGEYSPIIQTDYGYYFVAVIEKDDQHPLSPDALSFMRKKALQDWLSERREQSMIERIIP